MRNRVPQGAYERLELYDAKVSRTVLRGRRSGNATLLPDYANTAGHTKLRKLGQQSGAAAAFAGEPARGALIAHAGADKTTLARLSSLLEQSEGEHSDDEEDAQIAMPDGGEVAEEEAALKVVFARRAEELRTALARGREWLGGIRDDLAERLATLTACPSTERSVWAERPQTLVPSRPRAHTAVQGEAFQPRDDTKREVVESLPVLTSPLLPEAALSPAVPAETALSPLPAAPVQEPAPVLVVGSRAEVVFGRDEHIALVRVRSRPRRAQRYGEPLKRRVPVSEREIPSLTEYETAGAEEQSQQVAMSSLWDLLVAPMSGARVTTPSLFAASSHSGPTPRQTQLWE